MPPTPLADFALFVFTTPAAQARLLATADTPEFMATALELAAEQGFAIAAEELEALIHTGRRRWLEYGQ